jgi:hypothetical protein
MRGAIRMKLIAIAAVICAVCSPLSAADKITLKLSPDEMYALVNLGIAGLDGAQHIVHDARGQEIAVPIPFEFGDVRLTIAHDKAVIDQRMSEVRAAGAHLSDAEKLKLGQVKVEIELLSFDVSELNLGKNQIPPSILAELAPICPTCVGIAAGVSQR